MTTLETILITLVLLLPPLVLWCRRKFCERHPATVAFRAVPLGCLTMLWTVLLYGTTIPWLYYKVLERNPPHWMYTLKELPVLLLAVPFGIAVIVFLSRRLAKAKERPHGCLYPAVFVGAVAVALAVSLCCSIGHGLFDVKDFNKKPHSWRTVFLPPLQDCRVAFEQRPTHPFLAEYDYRIRMRHGKEQACFQLWPNTGGRTFVNVYKVDDDKLLLKDKDAAYVVDATRRQVYLVDVTIGGGLSAAADIHFAVPLSEKPFDSLGGHAQDGDLEVDFTDGTTARAIPYDVDLSHREYVGCVVDNSFYTPDEQSEGEEHPRYRSQD